MEIFIITICNKNEDYSNNLIKKYIYLIKKFYKLSYIDISFKTEKVKKNLYDKEYRKAISLIKPNSTLVALDENGKHMSSQNFSKKIKLLAENNAQIYFLIGGPDGRRGPPHQEREDLPLRAPLADAVPGQAAPHRHAAAEQPARAVGAPPLSAPRALCDLHAL